MAYSGQNLAGKCPKIDYSSVGDPSTLDAITQLCYQKYVGIGLAPTDYEIGAGADTHAAQVQAQIRSIQFNPSMLIVPQPGTVPVDPSSGLFAQVLKILQMGATPILQAKVLAIAQQAQKAGQPVYVPPGVAQQASVFKSPWVLGGAGAVVLAMVALVIVTMRKK
jgi:hypothetical protein